MAAIGVGILTPGSASAQTVTNICDRTPEVEQAILAEVSGATCSTITAAQLSGITNLEVTGYSNSSIIPGDFAGLTALVDLRIEDSPKLMTTPANAFSEVSSTLTTLYLTGTSIETLQKDTFNGLSAVVTLYLNSNYLTSLDPDLFEGMTSLATVKLYENYLRDLEPGLFNDSPALRDIDLTHNLFTEIGEHTFSGLSSLWNISLLYNKITTIHQDAFDGLDSISLIDLRFNNIRSLHQDTFDGLTSLGQLYLRNNQLTSIHRDTFDGLTSLWDLRLSQNSIASLHPDTFDGLTSLYWLHLQENNLTTLDQDLFDGLTSLNQLYIHRNRLASIHGDTFDGLTGLTRLALSNNELQTLPAGLFTEPTSLTHLYLNTNSIASLDEDIFDGLTSLQQLHLRSNNLSTLHEDIFEDLSNLLLLSLYDNGLTSPDEDLFDGLSNLQILNLQDNGLASPDENLFDGLSSLQTLSLQDNGLASPHADLFDGLGNLATLDLSGNSMTTLTAGMFDDLDDSLKTLRLQGNALTGLTASIFTGLTGMEQLDLSCNQIATLDLDEFDPFAASLSYLDISGNSFTTPPTETALQNKLTNTNLRLFTGTNSVCQPPTDIGIRDLRISNGIISPEFEPPGASDTFGLVDHEVTRTTITIIANDPHATVEEFTLYDDDPNTPGWQVKLPVLRNVFKWDVRSKSGKEVKTYTLEVFRAPPVPVTFSRTSLTIDEGGSDAYTIKLDTEPTAAVEIRIAAGGDVSTQPPALLFTPSNWNMPQTVEVSATEDTTDATDDTVTITHTVASGSAPEYFEFTNDLPSVRVTVLDNDIPPPPVRGLLAVAESNDAIALIWFSERDAAEYQVEYRKQGETGNWTRITRGDFGHRPSTSYIRSLKAIATGLDCNTTYDFRIRMRGSGTGIINAYGPYTQTSQRTAGCGEPDRASNLLYTLKPDCATLTWTPPTGGDYTGIRIRRFTLGEGVFTTIHESLNSKPDTYRDCRTSGDGYGQGDNPEYAYMVSYIKSEGGKIVESAPKNGGASQYGPALTDHLHTEPRNVRLTQDTAVQRRMAWDAPPSHSLTIWAGLQGANVPVPDPWITGYRVERREFNVRGDGYFYFTEEAEELELWSATLTVAQSNDGNTLGFSSYPGDRHGSLTDDAFNHVEGVYNVGTLTVLSTVLQFTLDNVAPPHASRDWILVIDGQQFPLADALVDTDFGPTLISWQPHGITWTNGQLVNVQLIDRDRYAWKTVRQGGNGDTGTSFVDREHANGRKFVYRIRTSNQYGISERDSIFDWLWDSPYRDAVTQLAATDTSTDDETVPQTGNTGSTDNSNTNTPPSGTPIIRGTPQVGETLLASTSGISDADGLTGVAYRYQWTAGGTNIDGATTSTYTPTPSDMGKTIRVKVTFTDDGGNNETLTSQPTTAVAATTPSQPTGLNVATGNAEGEITVSWQAPASNGGSAVTGYRVQWKKAADSWDTEADVSHATATGTTHTITSLTGGVEYAVRVMATNSAGDGPASTEAKGTPTGGVSEQVVEPENSAPTGFPTIGGTPQVDQTLTADTSEIDDEDGLTNVSYEYQWIAGGSDIAGATGSSYTLTYSEQGQTIQVRVTFTDDADNEETLTSEATVAAAAAPNRKATGQPTISGTPQVEQTLTTDTSGITDEDGLDGVSYEYQWTAGGTDIDGATGSSYTLTYSEQGQTVQVRVTFTDDRGNSESLTSKATDAVVAKPIPLTATFSNVPASHSGSGTTFTFDLAFSENFPLSYITLRDHAFSEDDDGPVTGAQRKVQGSNQTWTITVEPKGNGAITVTLPATTDCNDSGAICTSDGRKLSHSLSFTVSGPGQ